MKAKGDELEKHVLKAGAVYEFEGRARIEKTSPPIRITSRRGRFVTGRLEGKSSVDFKGCLRNGRHFAFDAKECGAASFPLKNIADHQMADLKSTEEYSGIGFILVSMTRVRAVYCIGYTQIMDVAEYRKSIPLGYMHNNCFVCNPGFGGVVIDWLPYVLGMDQQLKLKENQLNLFEEVE